MTTPLYVPFKMDRGIYEEFASLMNIAIEGPPIEGFDFDSAQQLFDKKMLPVKVT